MPPKKSSPAAAAPKAKAAPAHGSYQAMITDAIVALKDRNGSSRQQLKKYVKANNNLGNVGDNMFDSLFNKALKAGVTKGVFEQPKGPSGGTKLAKKAAPAAPKKVAAPKKEAKEKKEPKEKKPAAKKAAAPKKETKAKEPKEKKAAAPKKEKKAAPAAKKSAPGTAVQEKPAVLTKTKSGRVAKSTAKPAAATKKAAPKKAAAPKKEKTPKKADKAEAAT